MTLITGNTWSHEIAPDGAFVRAATGFRGQVSRAPGAAHAPAAGRYHLYVSLACPWAHRTLIVRALKGLEDVISVDVVHPHLTDAGWSFDTGFEGATGDRVGGLAWLQQVYRRADPAYAGIVTVPVLWDRQFSTLVNNESSEIIRMLNTEFDAWARHPEVDLYPAALRGDIDAANGWIYPAINNGVYRCGFARSQAAYDEAVDELFAALDRAEALLAGRRWLCGDQATEADVRLYTTLIRFDSVYHTHFKCNRRQVAQYPALHRHTARVHRLPGVAATLDQDHIRHHYYHSHRHLNPGGIVPAGPDVTGPLMALPLD
ncbi:glutathione S-transferase family protein [Rubrivivax sp. A210]|uniref:glutathione S-transferase family protein n=1 Tax=Rubrivivax sp. A210 TaxID=2772301 RepID=UPI001917B6B9|nr:glutathione S-transferase C-terminal domain-containing protein [Rubrivivax sp. A210]